MLNRVIVQIEPIAVLAHLHQIRLQHLIHTMRKFFNIIAGTPIAITVLLRDAARVAVGVGSGDDGLLFHQIGQQTRRIVRNGKTIIQEDETTSQARTKQS